METVKVIKPGSTVRIGGDVKGHVLSVTLRATSVDYVVTWWDGRSRKTESLESFEVGTDETTESTHFGF